MVGHLGCALSLGTLEDGGRKTLVRSHNQDVPRNFGGWWTEDSCQESQAGPPKKRTS